MSSRRTIAKNAISNTFYFGLAQIVSLATLPFLLGHFGRTRFGIYAFANTVLALLSFFNAALNLSLTKYVAESDAESDQQRLQAIIGNSYLIAIVAHVVMGALVPTLAATGASFFRVPTSERHLFIIISLVLGAGTALNGPFSVPRGILGGLQRLDLRLKLDLIFLLSPLIGVALVVWMNLSLPGYVALVQLGSLAGGILCFSASRRLLPRVRHRPSLDRNTMQSVATLNSAHVIRQITDVFFYTADRLIIQIVLGPAVVADYVVVQKPRQLTEALISLPLIALLPAASKAYAVSDEARLKNMLISGTRFYMSIVVSPIVLLLVSTEELLRLWLGAEFVGLAPYIRLFVFSVLLTAPFRVFSNMMWAKGRIKEPIIARLVYAPINVSVSFVLAHVVGLVGVILPTLFFFAVVTPLVWGYMMVTEGVDIRSFLRSIKAQIAIPVIGGSLIYLGIDRLAPSGIGALVVTLGLGSIVLYAGFGLSLTHPERKVLWDVCRGLVTRSEAGS